MDRNLSLNPSTYPRYQLCTRQLQLKFHPSRKSQYLWFMRSQTWWIFASSLYSKPYARESLWSTSWPCFILTVSRCNRKLWWYLDLEHRMTILQYLKCIRNRPKFCIDQSNHLRWFCCHRHITDWNWFHLHTFQCIRSLIRISWNLSGIDTFWL